MRRTSLPLLILVVFLAGTAGLDAQYSQNFNTYAGTAATIPAGWTVAFTGTSVFNGVGTGTSATGGAWAYGLLGENSFGALRSGTPGNLTLAVGLVNNTGLTLTSLTISFNYEQWRYVNTSGFDLSGTGALAGNATVNAADFAGTGTGTNGIVTTTPTSLVLTGLSIAPGAFYGLSWVTTDVTGSDNGIAIDDFITNFGIAVPEPSTWAMMIAGAGLLGATQRLLRKRN